MRIIAGDARRTALEVAPGTSTRPFLEMARGALFNALGDRIADAAVLDLYAGSGALGLEALSRGAASAVFVEFDPKATAALKRNIVKCGMERRCRIVRGDVLHMTAAETREYDVIFLDPPFPELAEWRPGGRAEPIMRDTGRILASGGSLAFRLEDGKADTPDWPGLVVQSDRRYGRSRVCRYGKPIASTATANDSADGVGGHGT